MPNPIFSNNWFDRSGQTTTNASVMDSSHTSGVTGMQFSNNLNLIDGSILKLPRSMQSAPGARDKQTFGPR
jgi:hypothetical protein